MYRLKKQARDRGYDPAVSRQLKLEYVVDKPRSGRPRADASTGGAEQGDGESGGKDGEGEGEKGIEQILVTRVK